MTGDSSGNTYIYDAWNRLAQIGGGYDQPSYSYDALNRRVQENVTPFDSCGPGVPTTIDVYFSKNWQVLEERKWVSLGGSDSCGGGTNPYNVLTDHAQYVWGLSFIDDLVLRDRNTDGDPSTGNLGIAGSGLDERLYAQHDADHNVTSIAGASAGTTATERFIYDPYGTWAARTNSWSSTTDNREWTNDRRRMTRGRCGWLRLHRLELSSMTPHRLCRRTQELTPKCSIGSSYCPTSSRTYLSSVTPCCLR